MQFPIILAGWFDFIGTAASAISDATWKVALINAIERTLPTLLLMTVIIGAIGCAWAAAVLAGKFAETGRAALRDDKVTWSEWIVLALQTLVVIPVTIGLIWFGFFLAQASRSGLLELMK